MAKRASTGRNEVGMMTDVKSIAEKVGTEILGFEVEWVVETTATDAKRPDVEIRRADGSRELIISGEAKKPEVAEGIHAYVASEVHGAVGKAKSLGGRHAFTTNFLEFAIWDVTRYDADSYLDALEGGDPIPWIDESETAVEKWWHDLTRERLEVLVRPGLERFFTQLRQIRSATGVESGSSKDEVYLSIFKQATDAIVAAALPSFLDAYANLKLTSDVLDEAKARGLDLSKGGDVRYFVAQAVAEILTSGLFYQTVRQSFDLRAILSGTTPATSALLVTTIQKNLAEATRVTGDYETIFGLSDGALWMLGVESAPLRAQWINLFDALSGVKFEEVTSEIVGVIFERLISAERRQDMGQHYTQSRLARAMTQWAVDEPEDLVADLSAGGGTFLVEAYSVLRAHKTHEEVLRQVFGNDLDSFAVHLATVNMATRDVYKGQNFPAISNRDAFEILPGDPAVEVHPASGDPYRLDYPARFDVILGNPPYDEKADNPEAFKTHLAKIAGANGMSVLPKGMPDTINLAAWFILLGAAWLKPEGKMALVLPASILQNDKHAILVRWLRANYDLAVWHTEADIWFSDARVAPVTIFAMPRGEKKSELGRLSFVNVLDPVTGDVKTEDGLPVPDQRYAIRDLSTIPPEADVVIAGTVPDALLEFEKAPNIRKLDEMASVQSGNKLGHEFYRLRDMDKSSAGVVRTLRGFDIPTKLHNKYLIPLLDAPKDAPTGEFHASDAKYYVLNAPKVLPTGGELEKYVRAIRRTGANDKPTIKTRGASWWSVQWKASRIAVAIHPQFQHQVWWNDEPYVSKNNMHTVTFDNVAVELQELVAASMSSAFGALSALYRSGEVGCEGVRWLSTGQFADWRALDYEKVAEDDRKAVLAAYRAYRVLKTSKIYELPAATKTAWLNLTTAVAKAAGMSDPKSAAEAAVKEATETTLRRREREMKATSGRTRAGSSGGNKLLRDIKIFTESHSSFRSTVDALVDGDETLKLKIREVETTLFDMDGEVERIEIGNELARLLGEGFEAAPVWSDSTVSAVDSLLSDVTGHFVETGSDGKVIAGFERVAETITETAIKTLQTSVKKRLS
jgi:hypothetical protein